MVGFSVLCGIAGAEPGESPQSYRKVVVRVVDENGEPLPGVTVQLLGIGRDALQAMDMETAYNLPGVWRYVSDAHGRCTVRLGCFKGFDSQKLVGRDEPGWGRFYLIAETGRLRGVSKCIVHESHGEYSKDYREDEWNRQGIVKTSANPVALTLRMRQGIRVIGRVVDTAGKPVRSFDIGIEHDLHSGHHTGYGNEIFRQSIDTDDDGRFMFNGTFPNTFRVRASVEETNPPVWVRTRLRGRWSPEPVDWVTPRRGEQVIRMTLVVSRQLPFRYAGRVLDGEGKPVAGAAIALGLSRHRHSPTYGDDHTFLNANSDAEGRFDFRTATPFVRWLSVKAAGFADYEQDYEAEDTMKAPGQWNIILHRH